jgi:hypothetical protein
MAAPSLAGHSHFFRCHKDAPALPLSGNWVLAGPRALIAHLAPGAKPFELDDIDAGWEDEGDVDSGWEEDEESSATSRVAGSGSPELSPAEREARAAARKERQRARAAEKAERRKMRAAAAAAKQKRSSAKAVASRATPPARPPRRTEDPPRRMQVKSEDAGPRPATGDAARPEVSSAGGARAAMRRRTLRLVVALALVLLIVGAVALWLARR